MIQDTLPNAASYYALSSRIRAGLEFLLRPDVQTLAVGTHELEGKKLFAMVQEYTTKRPEETFWETHRKYIDIQCVQRGIEAFRWSPKEKLALKTDYNPERDIFVWEGSGATLHVPAGSFVIFFPQDAHMGGLLIDTPQPVRKVVIKVGVE